MKKFLTFEQFEEKARKIHNNEYQYFKNTYKNYYTKLPINCQKHGIFYKTPHEHITKKRGCQICSREKKAKELIERKGKEFKEKAAIIHNNFYNYDNSEYKGCKIPITITCPIHGGFQQLPNDHLNGHGCQKCNQSKLEKEVKNFLLENNITFQEQFKLKDKLSLDFYLLDYNIAIECQGIQHFEPIKCFGGNEEFEKIKNRDIRKLNICKEKDIKLLYFLNKNNKIPDIQIYNTQNTFNNKEKLLKEIYLSINKKNNYFLT